MKGKNTKVCCASSLGPFVRVLFSIEESAHICSLTVNISTIRKSTVQFKPTIVLSVSTVYL